MPSVSHSRADGYLLCRRKDYYGYTLGLQKVYESDSTGLGSAYHQCLEVFYRTVLAAGTTRRKQKAAFKQAVKAMHEHYLKLVKEGFESPDNRVDLKEMLRRYVENEPFVREGYLIKDVEVEFLLEYDEETKSRFRFVIDLIVEDPTGLVVIVDHKTAYDFFDHEMANLQGQVPKYIAAMRGLGYKAHYGMYSQIRTRPIRGEKKLKGELVADLGKAGYAHHELITVDYKEVDNDGDEYTAQREELVEVPLSKLTVKELEAIAKDHGIDLYSGPTVEQQFELLKIEPSASRVIRTFEEQVAVAEEITARETLSVEEIERTAFRTANKMVCKSCDFRELCEAELAGRPTKLLLQTEFKVKERRPEIEVSEEVSDDE